MYFSHEGQTFYSRWQGIHPSQTCTQQQQQPALISGIFLCTVQLPKQQLDQLSLPPPPPPGHNSNCAPPLPPLSLCIMTAADPIYLRQSIIVPGHLTRKSHLSRLKKMETIEEASERGGGGGGGVRIASGRPSSRWKIILHLTIEHTWHIIIHVKLFSLALSLLPNFSAVLFKAPPPSLFSPSHLPLYSAYLTILSQRTKMRHRYW